MLESVCQFWRGRTKVSLRVKHYISWSFILYFLVCLYSVSPAVLWSYGPLEKIYLAIGISIILVSIWAFFQNPTNDNIVPQHKKMIFRKKYWLFYVLTMLAGARRQIFIAFAVFLLVKKFNSTVQEITILFVANNIMVFICPNNLTLVKIFTTKWTKYNCFIRKCFLN